MIKSLYVFFIFCVLCAWAFFIPPYFYEESAKRFEIQPGDSTSKIVKNLKKDDLVYSYFPYVLLLRWTRFQAGEYLLSSTDNAYKIFRTFSLGKVITYDITFPEGFNMFEMADLLEKHQLISKEEFLKWCKDSEFISSLLGEKLDSLEGYLYPNTYKMTKGMQAKKLIELMVGEFLRNYQSIQSSFDSGLTRHQLVILASLVEKETGAAWERPLIASVFYNRLKKGMKFQSDPTILYGMMMELGFMPKNIRKQDIRKKTDYNTYTLKGFPKGPIANPGRHAFEAILNPDKTSYYYFVSKNDGTHVFSKDLESHEKAVDLYQRSKKK